MKVGKVGFLRIVVFFRYFEVFEPLERIPKENFYCFQSKVFTAFKIKCELNQKLQFPPLFIEGGTVTNIWPFAVVMPWVRL